MPLHDQPITRAEPSNHRSLAARQKISRRRMLGGTVGAAGLAALGGGIRNAWSAAQPATEVAGAIGADLVEPLVLRSVDGRLDVALEASYGPASMGRQSVTTYNYNGSVPGPTLRMRAGETLGITLTNHLQLDDGTNLHTHGLHVSPAGHSDNVLLELMPGETFAYEFAIPRDRTSGLYIPGFYWYHPHLHGDTAVQTGGGMAGALIAEIAADGTLLLFADMLNPTVFVNGQSDPTIAIAPGETQRWRIVYASVFTFMNLSLADHLLH